MCVWGRGALTRPCRAQDPDGKENAIIQKSILKALHLREKYMKIVRHGWGVRGDGHPRFCSPLFAGVEQAAGAKAH